MLLRSLTSKIKDQSLKIKEQPKKNSSAVLFTFGSMKRFYFLLLITVLSTFHASAQTHFITAGQTQGMIFTDYVPDYNFPTPPITLSTPWTGQGNILLDINHDSISDFQIYHYHDYLTTPTYSETIITALNSNSVLAQNETCGEPAGIPIMRNVAMRFTASDTCNFVSTLWNASAYIYASSSCQSQSSPCNYTCYDNPTLADYSRGYYFIRVTVGTDTLLGYIHFEIGSKILDYAIEGPTSSYINSSIDDLFPSNISISPSPFTNQININYSKPFNYQITDYLGRVVLEGKAERTINTEQLPAGNYLLVIKNEETYSVKKIVKAAY